MNRIVLLWKLLHSTLYVKSQIVVMSSESIFNEVSVDNLIRSSFKSLQKKELESIWFANGFVIQSIQSCTFSFFGKYVKKPLLKFIKWQFIIPVTFSLRSTSYNIIYPERIGKIKISLSFCIQLLSYHINTVFTNTL